MERLRTRRLISIGLILGIGASSMTGCDTPNDRTSSPTQQTETTAQNPQPDESQIEIYPLTLSDPNRSANIMVFNLDDGTRLTCIESTVIHPASRGRLESGPHHMVDQGPEFDTNLVCPGEIQETPTSSTPR